MKIGELASTSYLTVSPHESVASVEERLVREKFVVIEDEGRYVGLLTLCDRIKRPHVLAVDCLCERVALDAEEPLERAIEVMEEASAHFLPVLEGGRFVGVASYKALVEHLQLQRQIALESYHEIFEASNDAIFVHDDGEKGEIRDANQRAVELSGYSLEELRGMTPAELSQGVEPFTEAETVRKLRRAKEWGRQVFEWGFRRKSGEVLPVEISLSRASIGGRPSLIAFLRDITPRKKMEQHSARLEHAEAMRLAAGGIAHDFKNLVQVALSSLELVRFDQNLPPDSGELLDDVEDVIERAQTLADQLVLFAKYGTATKETTDLGDLMAENARLMTSGRNVDLLLELSDDLAMVDIDREQFAQVVYNLVINAIQACEPDRGAIQIQARNLTLTERDDIPLPPGEYVELMFRDNGQGIDEAVRSKIFEPFFTTKNQGTGLGLPLISSIVARHGGHITVESAAGQGTTFRIYLPASA